MNFKDDFFVIGTDTDVGKTYISSLFFSELKKYGFYYFKPVQSGCFDKDGILTAPDVVSVCNFSNIPYQENMVCYTLREEVSPHLAAEKENIEIKLEKINDHYLNLKKIHKNILIEGAGGLFVPIVRDKLYIYDLIKHFNKPVVIVCGTRVGAINHTILTIKALQSMNIKIQGLVFNNYKGLFFEDDNINVILKDSKIKNYLVIKNAQTKINDMDIKKFFGGLIYE